MYKTLSHDNYEISLSTIVIKIEYSIIIYSNLILETSVQNYIFISLFELMVLAAEQKHSINKAHHKILFINLKIKTHLYIH